MSTPKILLVVFIIQVKELVEHLLPGRFLKYRERRRQSPLKWFPGHKNGRGAIGTHGLP